MSPFLQWAIIAFIVGSILWHVFLSGRANPASTGALQRDIGSIKGDVAKLLQAGDIWEVR